MALVLYQFAELKLCPLYYIQAFYVHRFTAYRAVWKLFGDCCLLLGILISFSTSSVSVIQDFEKEFQEVKILSV